MGLHDICEREGRDVQLKAYNLIKCIGLLAVVYVYIEEII